MSEGDGQGALHPCKRNALDRTLLAPIKTKACKAYRKTSGQFTCAEDVGLSCFHTTHPYIFCSNPNAAFRHLATHLLAIVCPLHRHFPCHAPLSRPHPSLFGVTTSSSPLLHNHHTPVALVLRRVLHSPWIKPLSDVCLPLHFGVVLPTCRRKSHCTAFYILSYPHALRISCN